MLTVVSLVSPLYCCHCLLGSQLLVWKSLLVWSIMLPKYGLFISVSLRSFGQEWDHYSLQEALQVDGQQAQAHIEYPLQQVPECFIFVCLLPVTTLALGSLPYHCIFVWKVCFLILPFFFFFFHRPMGINNSFDPRPSLSLIKGQAVLLKVLSAKAS